MFQAQTSARSRAQKQYGRYALDTSNSSFNSQCRYRPPPKHVPATVSRLSVPGTAHVLTSVRRVSPAFTQHKNVSSDSSRAAGRHCSRRVAVYAQKSTDDESKPEEELTTGQLGLISSGVLTAVIGGAYLAYQTEGVQEYLYGDGLGPGPGPLLGDIFASLSWGLSLYYASPVQLIAFFLGRIDVERPSDPVLKLVGRGFGLDVQSKEYEAPPPVFAVTAALFLAGGCSVATFCDWALGDPIWGVSTGLGSCILAGVYELGRPQRLSTKEMSALRAQWQDFAGWADGRLERGGRCHFNEVSSAFRKSPGYAKYRSQEALADSNLRLMIANWAPEASRTPGGFYKGLSLRARDDPFQGTATASPAEAAAEPAEK